MVKVLLAIHLMAWYGIEHVTMNVISETAGEPPCSVGTLKYPHPSDTCPLAVSITKRRYLRVPTLLI
jgi:hypothetical protein